MYRHLFPVFASHPDLVYLDSAATTQKPQAVIDTISQYYSGGVANPDRGLYSLSVSASEDVLRARRVVADFIGASEDSHVVFTSGATASINLVVNGLRSQLQPGDEIILSHLEHSSNLIPWQQVAEERSLTLKFLPVEPETGEVTIGELPSLLTEKTKIVALSLTSNVFGSTSPLGEVKKILTEQGSGALFLIDASQTISHSLISVTKLGADFVVFSSHKLYGPSGTGVLWGTATSLSKLTPSLTGGGTSSRVTTTSTSFKDLPEKLEGGTLNVEGIIGTEAAISFLKSIGYDAISAHLTSLSAYARNQLATIPGLNLISPESSQSIISFTIEGIHPHDIAQACADANICIRAGQHCAGPLHDALNLSASARVSFGLYNTTEDVDKLLAVLQELAAAYRA